MQTSFSFLQFYPEANHTKHVQKKSASFINSMKNMEFNANTQQTDKQSSGRPKAGSVGICKS